MSLMHADGLTGEVRVGGRVAAGLANWSLRPANPEKAIIRDWYLRATLVDPVPVFLTGGGRVEARVQIGKTIWRWREVELCEVVGNGVTLAVHGDFETM